MPSVSDYSRLIMKEGGQAFKSLKNLEFIPSSTTPFKIMSFGSGSFAAVFKARQHGQLFAIRCFLNNSTGKIDRYKKISRHLSQASGNWKVDFDLLEQEIYIDGQYLPILKMEWVNGIPINKYVDQNLNDFEALSDLQKKLILLNKSLEKNAIGHGDLQHGNILINKINNGIQLKLIDYDAMYVPALKNDRGIESGMKEYQHPSRTRNDFNEQIDRFSIWVMITAIEGIKYDKNLWGLETRGGYNTTENFLFQGQDFISPHQSGLMNRLINMPQGSVRYYTDRLKQCCLIDVNSVPFPELYAGVAPPPTTKKSDSPPKSRTVSNDTISIFTNPPGIVVQNALFQKIGNTPLVIDKTAYLNKSIKLVHNDKVRIVKITQATNIIDINFLESNPRSIPSTPFPTINKFTVEKTAISGGLKITLTWDVTNADKIRILKNGKKIHSGSKGFNSKTINIPFENQNNEIITFTLEADNEGKTNKREITVTDKENTLWSALEKTAILAILGAIFIFSILIVTIKNKNNQYIPKKEIGLPKPTGGNTYSNNQTASINSTSSQKENRNIPGTQQPAKVTLPEAPFDTDFENTIRNFLDAERRRDLDEISSYFARNIRRYWDTDYPSKEDVRDMYRHSWKITENSYNQIIDIIKVDEYTYDLHTIFKYTTRNHEYKETNSKVRFLFDQDGKIMETYGM